VPTLTAQPLLAGWKGGRCCHSAQKVHWLASQQGDGKGASWGNEARGRQGLQVVPHLCAPAQRKAYAQAAVVAAGLHAGWQPQHATQVVVHLSAQGQVQARATHWLLAHLGSREKGEGGQKGR